MNQEQRDTLRRCATAAVRSEAKPMFAVGCGTKGGANLAVVGGSLILDLGEAERTFIYRCQDRFLAYTSLWRERSIFFAATDRHAQIYRDHVRLQRASLDRIRDYTGLFLVQPLLEPLYVGCDIDSLELFPCHGFSEQVEGLPPLAGFLLNQISPTYARLLAQLVHLLRRHGVAIDELEAGTAELAALVARCADKSHYHALVSEALARGDRVPRHTPTVEVTATDLWRLPDYRALAAFHASGGRGRSDEPARLFVKATRNSSGNLSAAVGPENYADEMQRLRTTAAEEAAYGPVEIERQAVGLLHEVELAPCLKTLGLTDAQLSSYKREQAERRQDVSFLVQPALPKSADGEFAGIGLSYMIAPDGRITPYGPTAQIYRDHDHKHFQGAYLSASVGSGISPAFHNGMIELCRRYLALGYRGPINFDACRTREGTYELIYDCNPRLTGVFPSLAVRDALQDDGIDVASVLTLGYRGEFVLDDLDATLDTLDRDGLLLTAVRSTGVVLLPNLCRDRGFDLHLVNVAPRDANQLLKELGALSAAAVHPTRLYW